MNFVLLNHQLEEHFYTYAITFNINLETIYIFIKLQNWSLAVISFIEISKPKRSDIIIGCIYRHPNMDLDEFNDNYINILLDKLSKENKSVFLLGDYNVDPLKYDKHVPTIEFLDSLSSHIFLPHIAQSTRISTTFKKPLLIIFSQMLILQVLSQVIVLHLTPSDHLPQFLIVPEFFLNSSPKSNIYERDWNSFDQENFILDNFYVDWAYVIKSENKNIDFSFECFLKKFNLILDKYLPLKKLTKQKLKFEPKPWITPCLQKSVSINFLQNLLN